MPRYEFKDDKSQKFWEITTAGAEVTARWGRIGTDGQTKTKTFDGEEQARKDYEKQISGKVKKGYTLVDGEAGEASAGPASVGASNPELEAVIRENPDDADAYLVYGDWLQSQGEPLGELVAIQHGLSSKPDDAGLRESESALLKSNLEYFFGPEQAEAENDLEFKEIQKWHRPRDWPEKGWSYGHIASSWRNGFVNALVFNTGYYGDDEYFGKDAAAILERFLATPGSRFVQRIAIGEIWMEDDYEGPDTTYAVDAIARSACAGTLREFNVTGGDHDLNGVSLNASKLWAACPNLETVVLYAGQLTVGTIEAPRLKRFAVQTGGLDISDLKAIQDASFPVLEDLEIWFGDEEYGGNCSYEDLEPILQRQDLKLSRLGIMNMAFGDEVCAGILHSPLLPKLRQLDLTKGVIGEAGAKHILDNREKFSHLEELKIAGYWSNEVAEQLKSVCANASVETRGPADDDYRYVEVGE